MNKTLSGLKVVGELQHGIVKVQGLAVKNWNRGKARNRLRRTIDRVARSRDPQ